MTPARKHAVLALGALAFPLAYEAVEVSQGPDGWPYSRWIRRLPPWLFLGLLAAFNAWFGPHILRKTVQAVAELVEQADVTRPEIEE